MKKIFHFIIVSILILSCNSPKQTASTSAAVANQLTSDERSDGWKLLFDGKNTKGWHRYGGGPIDSAWKIEDGALCLDPATKKHFDVKGDWDIVTNEEYDNFDLRLQWKISKEGNSGIFIFVHEDKMAHNWPWETGMEMQVLDNIGAEDNKKENHLAGTLYDLLGTAANSKPKPVGEWNDVEVKCNAGKLDFYFNGINIVSTTLWDDNWKKLVAGSKFRNMQGFGTYSKGHIGLQDHGHEVCFRNIKIRKL